MTTSEMMLSPFPDSPASSPPWGSIKYDWTTTSIAARTPLWWGQMASSMVVTGAVSDGLSLGDDDLGEDRSYESGYREGYRDGWRDRSDD